MKKNDKCYNEHISKDKKTLVKLGDINKLMALALLIIIQNGNGDKKRRHFF